MAMAHRAPYDTYRRHFGITDTAVETLRILLPDLTRTTYRTDEDLANLIDEWAWDSHSSGKVEKVKDEGRDSWLIDMSGRQPDLFALVRVSDPPSKNFPAKTIITVLTGKMVESNKVSGRWTEHGTSPGKPMVSLKGKLASKVIAIVNEASIPPEKKPAVPEPTPAAGMHKISWVDADEVRHDQEVIDRKTAIEFMQHLIDEDEIHPLDITVYKMVLKPTWEELKRKVQVQLE